MKKKVCIVTGSRAEYGLLYLLIEKLENDKKMDLKLVVTGSHLSINYGNTQKEIINDGFKISEVDLRLRGPGDMMGTKQSGELNFKIADLVADNKILYFARKEAESLLQDDENLEKAENINIARAYHPYARERSGWSRIS